MSFRLRMIMLILLVLVGIILIRQIKKKKLDLRYSLSWVLLDVGLILLTCVPSLLTLISDAMGIYSPVNMIFFCGFIFSLLIIYRLTAAISKMSNEIRKLTQKIALMEDEQKNKGVDHE